MRSVYSKVTSPPEFRSGNNELYKFIRGYLRVSSDEFKQTGSKITAEFIIDSAGNLILPRIANKTEKDYSTLEGKVIEVLKKMPLWKPAKCKGDTVAYFYRLPITF